jgi:asparagine synthase (glutamine-hydrolysing)
MNKPLLIGVLDHRLPIEVWDRPKKGFVFPFGEWMKEREQEIREKTNTHQLFNRKAVDSIWKRFVKGNIHWSRAWAPIVAGRFDRMF